MRYDSLDAFYAANEQRRSSREIDYGVEWVDHPARRTRCRVTYVEATGEVIAVRLGHLGPTAVEILGTAVSRERLDILLAGWEGQPFGTPLEWVASRLPHRLPDGSVTFTHAQDAERIRRVLQGHEEPSEIHFRALDALIRIRDTDKVAAVADSVEIDSDEDGFHLLVDADGTAYNFRIQGVAYELAGSRGYRELGEYRAEGEAVRVEQLAHPRESFECAVDGNHEACTTDDCECECHALAADDPKNTRFASTLVEADAGENPRYGPGNPDWEHDRARDDRDGL